MAWEYVSCSECGKEYQVQMYGPQKTRDWKVSNWNGVCGDCKEAAKAALVEKNKSGELVELTGSEKQIAWAYKIRAEFIEYADKIETDKYKLEDIIDECKGDHNLIADIDLIQAALATIIENPSSHWWIESKSRHNSDIIIDAVVKLAKSVTADPIEETLQADVEAEAGMMPPEPESKTIANITLRKDHIEISFKERSDAFKKIVKSHGYRWDTPWKKDLSFKTGDPNDRMAQIGHSLLAAGFCIRILNPEIREKIISGSFTQEHTRWISGLISKPDHFYISWSRDDDIYSAAKRIAGARYDSPGITVPLEHADEVVDFAEINKFKFTPAAQKLVERATVNKAAALVVELEAKEKEVHKKQDGMPVLDIPKTVDIDDSLIDAWLTEDELRAKLEPIINELFHTQDVHNYDYLTIVFDDAMIYQETTLDKLAGKSSAMWDRKSWDFIDIDDPRPGYATYYKIKIETTAQDMLGRIVESIKEDGKCR